MAASAFNIILAHNKTGKKMAIESVETINQGWSGTADHEGKASYKVTAHVKTTTPRDGPQNVLTHYQRSVRPLGSLYQVGNDLSFNATLTNLDCTQIDPVNWHVVANYKTTEGEEKKNKDGEQEKDPRLWVDEVSVSTATYQIPCRYGVYMGQVRNPSGNPSYFMNRQMNPGCLPFDGVHSANSQAWQTQPQAIINSAGTVFDPPPMKDYTTSVLRITRTSEFYDGDAAQFYTNTVNDNDININRLGYMHFIRSGTGKIESITGSRKIYGRIMYWEWTIEIHIEPGGWYQQLLDRGYSDAKNAKPWATTAEEGTPGYYKGDGNPYMGPGGTRNQSPSPQAALIDDEGHQVREPVLLNGKGGVNPDGDGPVWLMYGIYLQTSWQGLELEVDTPPQWLPKVTAIMPTLHGNPIIP